MKFIGYPNCTTCKNAYKHLLEKGLEIPYQNIKENPPTLDELKQVLTRSGKTINQLFNTSGQIYKELNLKEKIQNLTEDQKLNLLAQNGMLIKRPILITNDKILVGYKKEDYEQL